MKKINFCILIVAFLAVLFLPGASVFAWTEPTLDPPNGNVFAPINVSPAKQIKSGRLGVNGADPLLNYGFISKLPALNAASAALRTEITGQIGYSQLSSYACPGSGGSGCGVAVSFPATFKAGVSSSGSGLYGVVGESTNIQGIGVQGIGELYGVKALGGGLGYGIYASSRNIGAFIQNNAIGSSVYISETAPVDPITLRPETGYAIRAEISSVYNRNKFEDPNYWGNEGAEADVINRVAMYAKQKKADGTRSEVKIAGFDYGVWATGEEYAIKAERPGAEGQNVYAKLAKKGGTGVMAAGLPAVYAQNHGSSPDMKAWLAGANYAVLGVNESHAIGAVAVWGKHDDNNYAKLGSNGYGIIADGDILAGQFHGPVEINGTLTVTSCVGCTADIAESMEKLEKVEAGDIVTIDENLKMRKAIKDDVAVAGVVSSTPFMVMNEKENGAPLALTGIIDVKVNTENGAIKAGDFIVASSVPGIGMKATAPATTIGKALQSFSGSEGMIKVIAGVSWFAGADCK